MTHEYEVTFVSENSVTITMAYLGDENLESHEEMAISQAEDRLAYDGIDLSRMDIQEITAKKTGEYH